ncbi:ParE family toxin-like protein [Bythopirellula goksoeyrii]
MISKLTPGFRRDFDKLPKSVQERARAAYRRFQTDSSHPGLQFKRLQTSQSLWSIRVTESYRAVCVRESADKVIWFFIGTHAEYDKLLSNL